LTGSVPAAGIPAGTAAVPAHRFELAFACSWWRPRPPTWSYIPLLLRQGLIDAGLRVHDIDAQPPLLLQAPLAAALTTLGQRPWKYARPYRAVEARRVQRAVRRLRPDAVLEVADLVAPTVAPTWLYQDTNFAVAAEHFHTLGHDRVSTIPTNLATLQRLAGEQLQLLRRLDGVFTMGHWFRDYLVNTGAVAAERVHAVGGGITPDYLVAPPRVFKPAAERRRLLFVGGEFHRKGGDWLVEAVAKLNRQGDRRVMLTIAGPPEWPLPTPPPDWIDYRGTLPRDQVRQLFLDHDLFVMPSRYEAYGLVFLEAQALGMPCIGRQAWAMPELIEPGVGGAIWAGEDTDVLAGLIRATLDDDDLYHRCAARAPEFARANTWTAVAQRMHAVMSAPSTLHVDSPHRRR